VSLLSSPIETQPSEQEQLEQDLGEMDGDTSAKEGPLFENEKRMGNTPSRHHPPKKITELIEKFNVQPKFEVSPPFPDRSLSKLSTATDSQDGLSILSPPSIQSHESQSDEITPGLSSMEEKRLQSPPVGEVQELFQSTDPHDTLHPSTQEEWRDQEIKSQETIRRDEDVPMSVQKLVSKIECTSVTYPPHCMATHTEGDGEEFAIAEPVCKSGEMFPTTPSNVNEETSTSREARVSQEIDIAEPPQSRGEDSSASSQQLANQSEISLTPSETHSPVSSKNFESDVIGIISHEEDESGSDSPSEFEDDQDDDLSVSSSKRLRHTKSLGERTHGNRLSAPVSIFGRKRQVSEHGTPPMHRRLSSNESSPATPPKRDDNGMLIPSSELAKYIYTSRSHSLPVDLEVAPSQQLSPRSREEMILKKEPFKSFRKLIQAAEEEDLQVPHQGQGQTSLGLDSAEG
jgi:hypothetical protein